MKRWYINDTQDHISSNALEESAVTLIQKMSVLLVVRGMILAHSLPIGLTMNEVTVNQDMKALTPASNLSAEYLGYIIRARSQSILQKVEIAAHGTRRLKTETLLDVRVPELPMNSQRRIVEYLNTVELDVEKMHRILRKDSDLLDQIEQSILDRAFRGEL
jgi:restriction endonuclease S subunit